MHTYPREPATEACMKYLRNRESVVESLDAAADTGCMLHFYSATRKHVMRPYTEVRLRAQAMAGHLLAAGVQAGDRIMIILGNCPEFVSTFYGVLLAGGVAVPVAPPSVGAREVDYYLRRIRSILRNCDARFIVAGRVEIESLRGRLGRDLDGRTVINVTDLPVLREPLPSLCRPRSTDICFIQYTSGSTADPKGVPVTHAHINADLEGIGHAIKVSADDSCVSWMPLCHDMGLIGGMMFPIHYQLKTHVLMDPILLARPLYWLKCISEHKATISPGNNFAFQRCIQKIKHDEVSTLDLSMWRVALNGSEPIDTAVLEGFYEKFRRVGYKKEAMLPCYGLAEATLAVTFAGVDEEPRLLECRSDQLYYGAKVSARLPGAAADGEFGSLVSLGTPIRGVEVRIADDTGVEVPEGTVGRILVRGCSVVGSYYAVDGSGVSTVNNQGWLETGDIGFLYGGKLYFAGREKEMVVIRGKSYSAVDIERCVKDDRIQCSVAFGVVDAETGGEMLCVVVEIGDEVNALEARALRQTIQGRLVNTFGIRARSIGLTPPRSIPRTFNGKIRRLECARKFSHDLQESETSNVQSDTVIPRVEGCCSPNAEHADGKAGRRTSRQQAVLP